MEISNKQTEQVVRHLEKNVHQLRSTTSFIVSVEDLFGGKEISQDILVFASTSVARHKFLSFIVPPLSSCP